MKLGEFLETFSHNNLIRLVYKEKGGHRLVLDDWDDVSMDWEVIKERGKNRHYINNEVTGLVSIFSTGGHYPEAINIEIENLENQHLKSRN
jgi:hypothetical protein